MRQFLTLLSVVFSLAQVSSACEALRWSASDGVQLVGSFKRPAKPGAYTWVLLHGLGSNRGEWERFAHELASAGFGVLYYDARGHGESNQRKVQSGNVVKGETLDYRSWQTAGPGSPWSKMPQDLLETVEFLKRQPGVRADRIGFAGASLGANVAALAAPSMKSAVPLVLLSPGLQYAGLSLENGFSPGPAILVMASPQDRYAFQSSHDLSQKYGKKALFLEASGAKHGVDMLEPEQTAAVLKWITELPPLKKGD